MTTSLSLVTPAILQVGDFTAKFFQRLCASRSSRKRRRERGRRGFDGACTPFVVAVFFERDVRATPLVFAAPLSFAEVNIFFLPEGAALRTEVRAGARRLGIFFFADFFVPERAGFAEETSARTNWSFLIACQPRKPCFLANWARSFIVRDRRDAAVIK